MMRGRWISSVAIAALFGMGAPALAQESAASIAVGQSVQGSLDAAGETDRHQITLSAGQGYRFTLNAAEGDNPLADPYLRLLNSAGEEVASNDDSGQSLNSRIDIEAPASGVYYLDAGGFGGASGAYVLGAIERAIPTDGVPATTATSSRLSLTAPLSGSVDFDGDVDWHRIDLRAGSLYRVSLNAAESEGLPDPYLRLLDASGTELSANDDANNSLNSELVFAPTTSGVYFVEARNLGESGSGAYTLTAVRETLPTDDIRADTRTRGRIALGGEVQSALDFPRDTDWYRVNLQAGETYRFGLATAGDPGLTDPLLRLLNAAGDEVARDDDSGPGLHAAIEFIPTTSGAYYVEARGFMDDAIGGYRLTARQGDIPGDATTDVTLAANGDYLDGQLAPAGDTDWYALDLGPGATVRLRLNNSSDAPVGDPLMVVYNAAGEEVARDDDGGGDLNAYLEFTAATGGRYFVEARGFSPEAQGGYALQLMPGEISGETDAAENVGTQGVPVTSQISPADDGDAFIFTAVEGRAYRIFLDGVPGETTLDPFLRLIDQNGAAIAEDDDGGTGINSYLSFVAPESAVYFVIASAFQGASTGQYALRVIDTETPGNAGTEEFLDANDDARSNRIDMPGDKDWYAVELEAGASYRIGVEGSGSEPLADPMLAVLAFPYGHGAHHHHHHGEGGDEARPLASDDDSGPGRAALLTYRPEEAGGVFIQVTGKGRSTGGYTVTIQRVAE